MVYELRSPAKQFISWSDSLYVILEDGSMWRYDGEEWELIAECLGELLEKTKELSKKGQAVQWYTCELTEDVGCGKPLEERNSKGCAECPIYQRVQPERTSAVIGSGYIPYIDKDKHEPETMAGMIGDLGGW